MFHGDNFCFKKKKGAFLDDAMAGRLVREDDCVQVSTIHSAKGLEWKHVFVVRVNDGILPMNEKMNEEERRLMYVETKIVTMKH